MNTVSEVIDRYNINIFERYSDLKNAGKTNVTHYDLAKIFEYYTCIKLSQQFNQPFLEYNDIDPTFKEQNKMSRNDTGIDCSNLIDTIVQCKLRKNQLTWGECGTFFGSQNIFDDDKNETIIRWKQLILSRNINSSLSQNLKFRHQLFTDKTFKLSEMIKYCEELKQEDLKYPQLLNKTFKLRDYQNDCIKLITENKQNTVISLPTGSGKNSIIIYSMKNNLKYLIVVPRIILMEQLYDEIIKHMPRLKNTIQLIGDGNNKFNANKNITICVFNSVGLIEKHCHIFEKIYIDEAHHINKPEIYDIDKEENIEDENNGEIIEGGNIEGENRNENEGENNGELIEEELKDDIEDEIINIKTHTQIIKSLIKYNNNVYLSATIDKIDGFLHYTKDIRYMIDNKYLCDYEIKVPIFSSVATNKNICEYLVGNYRNIIIYSHSQKEGKLLNNMMNLVMENSCAYIDCNTPKKLRNDLISKYKNGLLPFLVNVRILVEGFDAPITKGVCFVHMPLSKTAIIQIIGRCLRLHELKSISSIILPFSTKEDGKSIAKFLSIMATNDIKIRTSYEKKILGGYISLDTINIQTDQENEEPVFRFEMIYNTMGVLQNREQIWTEMFNKLTIFIDNKNSIPSYFDDNKENKILYNWFANQKNNYKKKLYIMMDKNIYDIWSNFINSPKYKKYFVDYGYLWNYNFMLLKEYINKNGELPKSSSNNDGEKKLSNWIVSQNTNYVKERWSMSSKINYDLWTEFTNNEPYNIFFPNSEEIWLNNLKQADIFIKQNHKLPLKTTSLYTWIINQKQNYKLKKGILMGKNCYDLWEKFIGDNNEYFTSDEDEWKINFEKLKTFIKINHALPTKSNESEENRKLAEWLNTQKANYKLNKKSMKNKENYNLWHSFINHDDFKHYFVTSIEVWKDNLEDLKLYIDEFNGLPSSNSESDYGYLGRWVSHQKAIYKTKTKIMAEPEIYELWTLILTDERYKIYLLDLTELWKYKLDHVIIFIDTNSNLPVHGCKFVDGTQMDKWVEQQRRNYKENSNKNKLDDELFKIFGDFMKNNKYKKYFMSNEEVWIENLELLVSHINKNNKLPTESSIDPTTKKLASWHYNQIYSYSKKIKLMNNDNIYNKWTIFTNSTEYINAKNNK